MDYNFREIEKKWQKRWVDQKTYRVVEDPKKKKFYVLNMFPYPSGAGLHVGHPLGYIASDISALKQIRTEGTDEHLIAFSFKTAINRMKTELSQKHKNSLPILFF